jgi:hypothetical protein
MLPHHRTEKNKNKKRSVEILDIETRQLIDAT